MKKLITVRLEKPLPLTAIRLVLVGCVTEVTEIFSPIGTDTALLLLLNLPSAPLLITTKEPGPVGGALGGIDGSVKLADDVVSPGPGLT